MAFNLPDDTPISTVPEQVQDTPIPTQVMNLPSPETAEKRAVDAAFGLAGTLGMSAQDYRDAFLSGQEQSVRKMASSTIDQKFNEDNQKALIQKIRQKPIEELNPLDMEALTKPTQVSDPNSIFETEWAKKYMDHLNWPIDQESFNFVKSVAANHPDLYQTGINIGTAATAKIKWLDNLHDENIDGLSKTSYARAAWEFAKNLTAVSPLINRYYRYLSPDVLNLPLDEMTAKVKAANDALSPAERVAFTQYLKGESTAERFVNIVAPAILPAEASLVASALGAFRTSAKIGTASVPRLMSEGELGGIRKGFEDVQRSQVGTATTPRMITPDEILRAGGSRSLSQEEVAAMQQRLTSITAPRDLTSEEISTFKTNLDQALNRPMTKAELDQARFVTQRLGLGETPTRKITPEELSNFQSAIRNMVRDVSSREAPEIAAPLAAGDLDTAISRSAARNVAKRLARRGDPARDALGFLQNIFKTRLEGFRENPGNSGAAGLNAIEEAYDTSARSFPQMILNIARAEKVPVLTEALPEAIDAVKAEVKDQAKSFSSKLLDVSIPYREPVSNTWFADLRVGKNTTEYFKNEGNAHRAAQEMGLGGYEVKNEGAGFYIVKPISVDINTSGMRKYYTTLPNNQSPYSLINAFMGRIRSPNETLSTWQVRNRTVTDHAPSVLLKYMAQELEDLRKLASFTFKGTTKREVWDRFERAIDLTRSLRDPETGVIGYTFKNPGELEYHYMKWFGTLPTDAETKAYFSWVRVNDLDHAIRVISIVNHKQTNGVMAHRFSWNVSGEKVYSPEFEATPVTKFPGGSSHTMVVLGDKPGEELISSAALSSKKIQEDVNSGKAQMAELWAPEYKPLAGYGAIKSDHYPLWVVSYRGFETKPIDWTTQLPKQGGGHFAYDAAHWIAQPNLTVEKTGKGRQRVIYLGDNKYMPFTIQKLGKDVLGHINNAFEHLRGGREDSAKNIVESTLKMDWDEFKANFKKTTTRDPSGRFTGGKDARFNSLEPFQLIDNNGRTDVNALERRMKDQYPNAEFVDGTRSGSRNKQFQVQFSQERDASDMYTINDKGSAGNPIYRQEKAKLLDAIPTMNKALTRVSNSFMMDDYKNFSFNHWLKENEGLLDIKPSMLESSPLYWFHHAEYHPNADKALVYQAETQRLQIKQFLGQISDTDNLLHVATQRLINSIYERIGPKAAEAISPTWLLSTMKDPSAFIRSMTFHLKMGWSLPQLFVQSNIFVNILGIAGATKASQGTMAAMMHLWTKVNSDSAIISALDRKLTYLGWKPGEFTEARNAFISSGFANVGREIGMMDSIMSNKVITTGGQKFLDWSGMFFRGGDSMGRWGAWYTAFKEFRDLHPTGAMTNADTLSVLERASTLNANMTRSSNNLYQKGWSSLPLQFMNYSIRQAELLWGHRLTPMEKGRLLLTNSVIYGIPVGLGVTGLPSEYWMRQNAIENGYIPDSSNFFESMFTEGAPSTALALINGGTFYNIPDRYGSGSGIVNPSEAFRSDKTMWDIFGGATGGTLKNLWDSTDSFRQAMLSGMRGDGQFFTVTPEHIAQVAKEAVAFNSGWRLTVALKTGNWMSKNEKLLDRDVNPLQAIIMSATGVQTQAASDLNSIYNVMEDEKALAKWAENKFTQEYHRGLRAYENKDPDNGQSFMTNAFKYMDIYIPDDQKTKIIADASRNWETTIEKVNDQFRMKNLPPTLAEKREQSWIKLQQLNQGQH